MPRKTAQPKTVAPEAKPADLAPKWKSVAVSGRAAWTDDEADRETAHGILDGCELHVTIEGVSFVITLETA
jgi:hypothetical protein